MTQPLALLLYEKLLPGTQLVNRLQDLGWRVHTLHQAEALVGAAEEQKPVLVLADVGVKTEPVGEAIARLRQNHSTAHIPVIAFGGDQSVHSATANAGATLAVSDAAILQHLEQFIDQALSEF